jgi:RHS repeat-associated protein
LAWANERGTFLYLYDANSNVEQLVNSSTGEIAARYKYDPFGVLLVTNGPETDNNPFRFSTKYFDVETESYYYGFRYYDPETGRWPTRDPIGERGGWNLYRFIGNDPINIIDVLGLYTYLGVQDFHGIEASGGVLGTVEAASYVVSVIAKTHGFTDFEIKTSVGKEGCECCIANIEFFFKQKVYLPLIGETFRESEFGDALNAVNRKTIEITIDTQALEILTAHEYAHVEAEKKIAEAIFEKAESDFQGKCWTKWFAKLLGRTWDENECQLYAEKKVRQLVIPYFIEKTDEAARKLGDGSIGGGMTDIDKYLQWVDEQCVSWKEKQFINKD